MGDCSGLGGNHVRGQVEFKGGESRGSACLAHGTGSLHAGTQTGLFHKFLIRIGIRDEGNGQAHVPTVILTSAWEHPCERALMRR